MSSYLIGVWLFLIGSVVFTLDAWLDVIEGFSFRSLCRFLACLAFAIGCVLFVRSEPQE